MSRLPTTRRPAALALTAFLLAGGPTPAQDAKDDAEKLKAAVAAVHARVKDGAGLAKVREKLAADPVGSRFRVDGFEAGDKALVIKGVVLVPGATDEDEAEAEKAAGRKVEEAVREVAGAKDFNDFSRGAQAETGSVKAVRRANLPHLVLQKAANEAGAKTPAADELRLADARFDAKGQLVITGRRGTDPKTVDWLGSAATAALAENPAAVGPDGKRTPVTFHLDAPKKGLDWPLSPKAVQRALAESGRPELARVRVERAYPVSAPARADETNPAGVAWKYAVSGVVVGDEKPDPKALGEALAKTFAAGGWEALPHDGAPAALTSVPDPAAKFQEAVAALPALDGVRLDARTGFAADGKLALAGLQPGLDAAGEAELVTCVRGVLGKLSEGSDANPGYRRIADVGVSVGALRPAKVRELHAELRGWAAGAHDDVRLSRLYFDAAGRLTLTCEAPDPAVEALARKELVGRAAKLVPAAAGEKTDEAPEVRFAAFPGGLTRHLQQQTADPKAARWAALLIERGSFDEKNRYTVRGVADSEAQKKEFAAFLLSLKGDPAWAAYFAPTPPAAPDLEVIPMGRLVDRARRVMPADPAFDGVRVTAARYEYAADPKAPGQTLVFDAQVVGRLDPAVAGKLRDLIATDAKYYGRRLPKGRPVEVRASDKNLLPSAEAGGLGVGMGAGALAKGDGAKAREWVDAALLHHPGDSAGWFLSAYANHVAGDRELVRRDLYRVIEIEAPAGADGGVGRTRRYAAAKDLQGRKRDELEKLYLELGKEYKEGPRRITFAEPK